MVQNNSQNSFSFQFFVTQLQKGFGFFFQNNLVLTFAKNIKTLTRKYSTIFQIFQLTCIYFFAVIVLFTSILSLLNSLDISPLYIPIFRIPVFQSILQAPIVKLIANPEKNFFLYLVILEFVINRPVVKLSLLVKYNILLIFTLEMFQNLIFAYWDLIFNKEMFVEEMNAINKNIAFVISFVTLMLFLSLYIYSYFRALKGKFVRFPYMEWLTDSVAFWLRIKTSTMGSGNNNKKNEK
jgi:hypothetical protein